MRRKKKGPKEGKKFVRVDHKTIIEVNKDIPDDVAIAEYLEKTTRDRPNYLYVKKKHDGS